jgi:hypothetical protein
MSFVPVLRHMPCHLHNVRGKARPALPRLCMRGMVPIVGQSMSRTSRVVRVRIAVADVAFQVRTEVADVAFQVRTKVADVAFQVRTEVADGAFQVRTEVADVAFQVRTKIHGASTVHPPCVNSARKALKSALQRCNADNTQQSPHKSCYISSKIHRNPNPKNYLIAANFEVCISY